MAEVQRCITCFEYRSLRSFDGNGRGGLKRVCKSCQSANRKELTQRSSEYRAAQARYRRNWQVKQYGLTEDIYQEMLEAQGDGCAICGKPCPSGRRLAIDHNHQTGKVRALLCVNCNRNLGIYEMFREHAEEYLRKYDNGRND